MRLYFQNLLLLIFITEILQEFQCKEAKITFQEFLNDNTNGFNRIKQKVRHNENNRSNIEIELNEIESLLSLDEFDGNQSNDDQISFNEQQYQEDLYYDDEQNQNDEDQQEINNKNNRTPQNLSNKKIIVFTTNRVQDALDDSSIDTSIKRSEVESPLDEKKITPTPPLEISDPSDQQLNNMKRAQEIDKQLQEKSPETQTPMETKTQDQVYGIGGEKQQLEEEERLKSLQEEESKSAAKEAAKLEEEEKAEDKEKNISVGCDDTVDDGIMNCENGKNQIRIDDVNQKSIEKEIEELPAYEVSLYYGIVLCILIIIVLLLARFRVSLSKYLEKYYIKSLRIVVLDVIILMSLNTIVQIMYYNRILDVIQLEYFNIYGFTITFSFFSISWLFIATVYAFILQKFSNTYAIYEKNWENRSTYIDNENDDENDSKFEETVKNIQYFLIKEDFVMPVSHICYTEPMVLRKDFNFAEYLGRAQAKCHLQLFNISFSTLLILITFFFFVSLIDIIENWLIECILILILPIISFAVGWIENKRQLQIITQIITLSVHQYEIESIKFLNLDIKKPVQFANKLTYPTYITDEYVYDEEGISKHLSLFPFRAVQFPLKVVHFTLVLQIVWIMVFLFNYSSYLVDHWECQLLFSIGLFLILFQLFFIIPFFLKKYAVNSHIQQLKDTQIIEKVISNQKEQVTLSFQRFYRLLKHLRRKNSPKKNHIKLRIEIMDQLREIDSLQLKSIEQITRKLGFYNLQYDEYYYLIKAFTELAQQSGSSSSLHSSTDNVVNYNHDNNRNNNQNNIDAQERPTANPRNRITVNENNQQDDIQEEERKEEESVQLERSQSHQEGSPKRSEYDLDSSVVNVDQQDGEKPKPKYKQVESEDEKLKSEDKSEIDINVDDVDKEKQKSEDQIEKSGDQQAQHLIDQANEQFTLNKLLKICSLYTQEVVLDPYKASYEALIVLFGKGEDITHAQFEMVINDKYEEIEKEQLNLVLQLNDIKTIIKEVFYLEDKHAKLQLTRIASLIRNSIEMLPR